MDYFPSLLSVILTLFCLMVCGYICRKAGIIHNASSKGLSQLIISIGQPMMIISALANAEYGVANLTIAWQVTLIGFGLHILMALAAYLICRRMKQTDQNKIFEFTLIFSNCGFIGFPIMDAILKENGLGSFMGAFYVISFHLFLWTWGILILARGRKDIRMTPKKALLNYGTVPCAIGILLYLCKPILELPDFLVKTFSYLGNLCTPISVLITGALLATIPLQSMLKNKKLYLHAALKLLVFPLVACVLAKLCGLKADYILLTAAMAGMPSAATVTMLSELYDIEPGYASQTVGLTSVLSVVTLPVVLLFAQWIIGL